MDDSGDADPSSRELSHWHGPGAVDLAPPRGGDDAMTGTTVTVDRARLLAELRRAKVRVEAEHAKEVEAYPAKLAQWNHRVAAALRSLTEQLDAGKAVKLDGTYHGELTVPIKLGHQPQKPPAQSSDACRIERFIRTVELVSADTFKLRTDDAILSVILPDRCR
jgi:hypothetical protein